MGGNSFEPADGLARSFWPSPTMAEDLAPVLPHIAERTPVRTPVRGVPGRPLGSPSGSTSQRIRAQLRREATVYAV